MIYTDIVVADFMRLKGFEDFLKYSFKESAGSCWVEAGRYEIVDESGGGVLTSKDWKKNIKPGMRLSMAMVLRKEKAFDTVGHNCPSCNQEYQGPKTQDLQRVQWYVD